MKLILRNLLLVAAVGLSSAQTNVCGTSCLDEVKKKCIPAMRKNRAGVTEEQAIERCQRAIEMNRNPRLANAGCVPGCTLDFSYGAGDDVGDDIVGGTGTAACSSSCCSEITSRCVPHWMRKGLTKDQAISKCAQEVNSGNVRPLILAGCAPGCHLDCSSSGGNNNHGSSGNNGDSKPTTPTLCTKSNQGRCDCGNLNGDSFAGFKTYTWWISGSQRCATTYIPPVPSTSADFDTNRAIKENEKLPVMLAMNCYAKDRLNTRLVDAAKRFGLAMVYLSSPEGSWSWKSAVSNDANPMNLACSERGGGADFLYIKNVLSHLGSGPDTDRLDLDRIYAQGHSQNGMGAGYVGLCFPPVAGRPGIAGVWQGAAGLYEQNGGSGPIPPGKEGTCSNCQYWPVYPCYEGDVNEMTSNVVPLITCIQVSVDDRVTTNLADTSQSHGENMYNRLMQEGGDGRLIKFDGIGHRQPENVFDWMVGCLGGVSETCSSSCAASTRQCVNSGLDYASCLSSLTGVSGVPCTPGCTPTLEMLQSQTGVIDVKLSRGAFGDESSVLKACRPSTSRCVSDLVAGTQATGC